MATHQPSWFQRVDWSITILALPICLYLFVILKDWEFWHEQQGWHIYVYLLAPIVYYVLRITNIITFTSPNGQVNQRHMKRTMSPGLEETGTTKEEVGAAAKKLEVAVEEFEPTL